MRRVCPDSAVRAPGAPLTVRVPCALPHSVFFFPCYATIRAWRPALISCDDVGCDNTGVDDERRGSPGEAGRRVRCQALGHGRGLGAEGAAAQTGSSST